MEELKTADQVLRGCEFTQKVWMVSPMKVLATDDTNMRFVDIIEHCFRELQFPLVEIFFTTAWLSRSKTSNKRSLKL